ncbi:MAG: cytochrome b/b6 domain-containing protein [Halobacteria archaeon]|nr:cytochrome b/b6 domain-containing protein [Halobacteria archaeon]
MAIAVVGLLVTGWLQLYVVQYFQIALDYHYILAYALSLAVGLRLYLLVSSPAAASNWRDLVPNRHSMKQAIAMLRFYVSFGRTPLPHWYAHSPLWAPVYLFIFLLLLIQILSGFLIGAGHHTLFINLYSLHHNASTSIAVFTILHIISVFLHDLKAGTSDVSAMIHGYRIFTIEKPDITTAVKTVSLDKLKQTKPD